MAIKLNPRKKYVDQDGTVRTGKGWMDYFKVMAQDDINELKRSAERIGMTPKEYGVPSLKEQVAWMLSCYTVGGESDRSLSPVNG